MKKYNSYIKLSEINYKNLYLKFKSLLNLEVEYDYENNKYYIKNKKYNIILYGSSYNELKEKLNEVIYKLWYNYAIKKEENLTENEILLKYNILDIVDIVYEDN